MNLIFRMVLAIAMLIAAVAFGFAQDSLQSNKSTVYLGFQANSLMRQILNFGNPTAINNPYLLTFSANSPLTGNGLNVGMGYRHEHVTDGDNLTQRETTNDDFFLRIGYEKKYHLRNRWMASWGIDFLAQNQKSESEVKFTNGGSQMTATTEEQRSAWGLGPRFTLNYHITDFLLVGTEASYYFRDTKLRRDVRDFNTTSNNETTAKLQNFNLELPAALYLIFKF